MTTPKLTPAEILEILGSAPYVIGVKRTGTNQVCIDYPRERGGRVYMSLVSARRHAEVLVAERELEPEVDHNLCDREAHLRRVAAGEDCPFLTEPEVVEVEAIAWHELPPKLCFICAATDGTERPAGHEGIHGGAR